ncbi:MAG TPA: hypothetical protein VKQ08_06890, partial [Cyclobacteriaceae bacterium]|nr:hypothetical protein [Cyclobacteriaceae bacterium]
MTDGISNRKVILIVYEYFYPGFKAGGPVQSLVNLVNTLEGYAFKVITTGYDFNDSTPYPDAKLDDWNALTLQEGHRPVDVFYSSSNGLTKIWVVLRAVRPPMLYLNGLFTRWGFCVLLLKRIGFLNDTTLILAPRGMLQQGALSIKPLKKKLFLSVMKVLGLTRNLRWHATDEQEKTDIQAAFGHHAKIDVAFNIPKPLMPMTEGRPKRAGNLELVFLSLITEKKNLH